MELVRLGERTWHMPGRVNIGYYEENGQGYLIDTGLDDDSGRKILKLLREERDGVSLRAIINTHSNGDHIGGNAFIQKRTNCEIWTTRIEGVLTGRTSFEPMFFWTAWPFRQIRGKFSEAKPSQVTGYLEAEGPIMDTQLVAVPLPGHYLDMFGVRTPDGVFFLADSLFAPAIFAKYRFCVMLDLAGGYRTLEMIENAQAEWFVPSHAPAVRDIRELIRQNREGFSWVTDAVCEALKDGPLTREEVLSKLGTAYGMEMDPMHLLLNLSCVDANLTYLEGQDKVEPFVRDCRLLWRRKE